MYRMKCIVWTGRFFTENKVYSIVDGKLLAETGVTVTIKSVTSLGIWQTLIPTPLERLL